MLGAYKLAHRIPMPETRLPCGSTYPRPFPTEGLSNSQCKRMAGNGFHLHVMLALFVFTLASCVPLHVEEVSRAIVPEEDLEEEAASAGLPPTSRVDEGISTAGSGS